MSARDELRRLETELRRETATRDNPFESTERRREAVRRIDLLIDLIAQIQANVDLEERHNAPCPAGGPHSMTVDVIGGTATYHCTKCSYKVY
jgi:hypothetical protein